MRDMFYSIALIFFLAGFSLAGQKVDMKVFDSQPAWEIPLYPRPCYPFCEFSQDGNFLWVIIRYEGINWVTNCYRIAERRMIPSEDFATVSQPLSRLSWRMKGPSCIPRESIEEKPKGLELPSDILSDGRSNFYFLQFSPTGMPYCTDFAFGQSCRHYGLLFKTDFERFFCENVYHVGNEFHPLFFSEDGRRCCINKMQDIFIPKSKRCLMFIESERTQLDGEDFKNGNKIFWSELEEMTGDSLVRVDAEFISNTKIAIVATSSGRSTFFGRSYLLIYDFNSKRIVWARKSRNEFFSKRFGMPYDPILSVDEHRLAVIVAGMIYIYEFSSQDKEYQAPLIGQRDGHPPVNMSQ